MKTLLFVILLSLSASTWAEDASEPSLLELADQLFSAGQLEEAEARYQESVKARPGDPEVYMRLGGFYLSQHKIDAAIPQFQAALGADPEFFRAFVALGIAYWHNGNYPLTEAALQEAIRLQPDLPEAQKLLHTLQQKIKMLEHHHTAPQESQSQRD